MTLRIHVLRDATVEPFVDALRREADARGAAIDVSLGAYDAAVSEVESGAIPADAGVVLLAFFADAMRVAREPESGELAAESVVTFVTSLTRRLLAKTTARVAIPTFTRPIGARASDLALDRVNLAMRELCANEPRVELFDVARVTRELGEKAAFDRRSWLQYRMPLSLAAWEVLARDTLRSLDEARARKVLVLDCDGVLWGGVLGEDGPRGVRLSPEGYPGAAYFELQRQVVALGKSGVLLALASKNAERDVLELLATHPHCLLRPEHLAAHRIGWEEKAESLRAIARELNVGLDALVFVDDSPIECAKVAAALPEVEVLRAPENAHGLVDLLANYRGFSSRPPTAEDRARTQMIQAERARDDARSDASGVSAFLAMLELSVEVRVASVDDLPRVAQLTQRTNQFNTTTRRYTEAEIGALLDRDDALVLAASAADKFGDYGTVGVAIALVDGSGAARIDAFLLSCRALGRRVEDALLAGLAARVVEQYGDVALFAELIPTAKNAPAQRFYDDAGFTAIDASTPRTLYRARAVDVAAQSPAHVALTFRPAPELRRRSA